MPRQAVIADGDLPALVAGCIAGERWHLEGGGEDARPLFVADQDRLGVVGIQAELLGLDAAECPDPGDPTLMLIAAARVAHAAGATSLVWPLTLGGSEGELDAIARESDRAVLVSRLLSIDLPGAGMEIETPFVDLSPRQVAELAVDLDAPIETCSWFKEEGVRAGAPGEAWMRVLASLGWRPARRAEIGGST